MVVFFSDVHLGLGSHDDSRLVEDELISCLQRLEPEVDQLVLVGDLFHNYIEYRHLVPKGAVRLLGLLASWTDGGKPVDYVVGNHDPWHRNYFEHELGIRTWHEPLTRPLLGHSVYVAHGDGLTGRRSRFARRLLRHPVPVWMYRNLLPGDAGMALANWYLHVFYGDELDAAKISRQREEARRILETESVDLVVMGHSHYPERTRFGNGTYLNTGCWNSHRYFGFLDETGPALRVWKDNAAIPIEPAPLGGRSE